MSSWRRLEDGVLVVGNGMGEAPRRRTATGGAWLLQGAFVLFVNGKQVHSIESINPFNKNSTIKFKQYPRKRKSTQLSLP